LELHKIVVPVDFSIHARRALDEAIGLARKYGAELHLVHCYPLMPTLELYGVQMPPSMDLEVRQAARRRMAEWRDSVRAAGLAAEQHLSADLPSAKILELSGKIGADLIVIGSRGLSGLERWLLGSVAERTVRMAPCPVLTVSAPDTADGTTLDANPGGKEIAAKQIQKILLPVDFSDCSQRAFDEAVGLAKDFGAELHLLHCYQLHRRMVAPYGIEIPESLEHDVRMAALRRLSDWREKATAHGIRVREHISAHFPSDEIPAMAARIGANLIVMGTRGLTGLKHVLLGSVAERTMRAAPCPVLTVRCNRAR
jgi:nucleotide-binding universal stress UspA family protein